MITSRFTIAIHILSCIDYFYGERTITSDFLAGSIGVNPVIIRQIILKLKSAGIVEVIRGHEGIKLLKPLSEINFYDVYSAVEAVKNGLFRFHENPNPECPVGKNIHNMLDDTLIDIQETLEAKLKTITLKNISIKK